MKFSSAPSKDLVAEVAGEIRRIPQVYGETENLRKLHLQSREPDEPGGPAGLELDQHIDVAARREVLPEHAPEQAKGRDAVPTSEVGDLGDRVLAC